MKTTIEKILHSTRQLVVPATVWALSIAQGYSQTILEQAKQAFAVRNYRQAIALYEQGMSKEAATIEAQNTLAQCYLVMNQPDRAAMWFDKAMRNPEAMAMYPLLPLYYGLSLNMKGEYQQAKTAFSKLAPQYQATMEKLLSAADFAENYKNKNSIYVVKNETGLNSEKADFAPAFYQNKLIFTSSRTVEIMGGYSDATTNIQYIVDRNGMNLSAPKTISSPDDLSKNTNTSPVSYSKDGSRVAYMINTFNDGVRHLPVFNLRSGELEFASTGGSPEWGRGAEQPFPHFKQDGVVVGFPSLSADGKTLYFSCNSNAGYGGFDIYVSFWENGNWSEPQNLGPNINTMGDEVSPFIADDGKIYFSSNFHKGFGGYDVYCATLEANTWKSVRSLGAGVNSPADDLYFIFDDANNLGYFASNRQESQGDYDIYSAKLTGNENLLPFVLDRESADAIVVYPKTNNNNGNVVNNDNKFNPKPNPNPSNNPNSNPNGSNPRGVNNNTKPNTNPEEAPCALNFYIGAIMENNSKTPIIDASVYVKNLGTMQKEKVQTNKFGEYSLILEPMSEYLLVVSKSGFENETFQVQTKSGGQKTLLGTRYLRRAGTTNSETDVFGDVEFNNNNTNPNPTNYIDNQSLKPATQKFSRQNPNLNANLPNEGYVIQVGIFSRLSESALDKLAQYGNVTTEPRNMLTAYKVGTFADKQHAAQILAELKKEGYTEAWQKTVPIDNKTLAGKLASSSQVIFPPTANETPVVNNNTSTPIKENTYANWADNQTKTNWESDNKTANNKPVVANKSVEYKVQLGAFKEPEKVSFNNLADLAPIEKQLNPNGLTYFYLSGFETLNAAQQAKDRAAARGVQAPFVVGFKNGNRVALAEIK